MSAVKNVMRNICMSTVFTIIMNAKIVISDRKKDVLYAMAL